MTTWKYGCDLQLGDVVFDGMVRLNAVAGRSDGEKPFMPEKYSTYAPGRIFRTTRLVAGARTPAGAVEYIHISDNGKYYV